MYHSATKKYYFNKLLQCRNPGIGRLPIPEFRIVENGRDPRIWDPGIANTSYHLITHTHTNYRQRSGVLGGSSLLLNADTSDVIPLGTDNQLRLAASVDSVEVAGVTLPVALTLKSLGVILDQRLTFDDHATAVAKSCNYHTRVIKHVRHLLPESVARTLACSLINSRLDYCNCYCTEQR